MPPHVMNIQEGDVIFRLSKIYLSADPLGSTHSLVSSHFSFLRSFPGSYFVGNTLEGTLPGEEEEKEEEKGEKGEGEEGVESEEKEEGEEKEGEEEDEEKEEGGGGRGRRDATLSLQVLVPLSAKRKNWF